MLLSYEDHVDVCPECGEVECDHFENDNDEHVSLSEEQIEEIHRDRQEFGRVAAKIKKFLIQVKQYDEDDAWHTAKQIIQDSKSWDCDYSDIYERVMEIERNGTWDLLGGWGSLVCEDAWIDYTVELCEISNPTDDQIRDLLWNNINVSRQERSFDVYDLYRGPKTRDEITTEQINRARKFIIHNDLVSEMSPVLV